MNLFNIQKTRPPYLRQVERQAQREKPRPRGISDTQSYAWIIRNVFHDALAADPFFANYTIRKTVMLPVQPNLLPYLGIYIADETMTPDGDPNATTIKFSHSLRIGFSAIVKHSDQDQAEQEIDGIFWHIMDRLWTDQYIMNLLDTYNPHTGESNPDNVRIESLTRGTRRHRFGASGKNNETPFAELQYDVTVFYRTYWEPGPFDDLDTIDMKTGIEPGDSDYEMSGRPQAHVVYDFTQQNAPIPTVTGVAPATGPEAGGTSVTLTGTDFTNATAVTFGTIGPATSFTVDSATSITAVSPAGNHAVDITVTTPAGTSEVNQTDLFTYT